MRSYAFTLIALAVVTYLPIQAFAALDPTDPALIQETNEIQFTASLDDLVSRNQNDAWRIYNDIRMGVEYEAYYGSVQSSESVLQIRAGNDFDQATLLIAAYRRLGIPAYYVRGTIRMGATEFASWLGFADLTAAANFLSSTFLPVTYNTQIVEIEAVWVNAYLDVSAYRGVGASAGEKAWVPLAPWFVPQVVLGGDDVASDSGFDIDTFTTTYLASSDGRSPVDAYRDGLEAHVASTYPSQSLSQRLWSTEVVVNPHEYLPLSLPFQIVSVASEAAAIPADRQHLVTVSLTGIQATLTIAETYGHRLTVSYEPATPADEAIVDQYGDIFATPPHLIDVRPLLRLDGVTVASGSAIDFGSTTSIPVELSCSCMPPAANPLLTRDISAVAAGRVAILAGPIDLASADSIVESADLFSAAVDEIGGPSFDSDETLGEALNLQGLDYRAESEKAEAFIYRSMGIAEPPAAQIIAVFPEFTVLTSGSQITSVETSGLTIDVFDRSTYLSSFSGSSVTDYDVNRLRLMALSFLEHSVTSRLWREDAVSTVRVIRLASEQSIPIFAIDTSNRAILVPQLTLSAPDTTLVNSYLDAGYEVIVPRDPVTLGSWTGTGFFAFEPSSTLFAIISGGYNGGSIAVLTFQLEALLETGQISRQEADAILQEAVDNLYAPVENGRTTDGFGYRTDPNNNKTTAFHEGWDIAVPTGTDVLAVADGYVAFLFTDLSKAYGNAVVLVHGTDGWGNTLYSLTAHHSTNLVSVGDFVSQGTVTALSGSTGSVSTGPHVHYEVFVVPPGGPQPIDGNSFFKGGFEIDPQDYIFPEELFLGTP